LVGKYLGEGQFRILRNKRKFNIKLRRLYGSAMRMEVDFNRLKITYNNKLLQSIC